MSRKIIFAVIKTGYTAGTHRDVGPRAYYAEASIDQSGVPTPFSVHYIVSCQGTLVGSLAENEPNCSNFNVSLAAAGGHAVLAWHDTEDGGAWTYGVPANLRVDVHAATIVPGVFGVYPHVPISFQTGSGAVPWLTAPIPLSGNYAYGDYDSAAADPTSSKFFVAWGDMRNASSNNGQTELWVNSVTP